MTYLSSTQLAAARKWQPFYLEAQQRIGVPWALLAALHYRESNFAERTARVGSALQFDPPLSSERVRGYGKQYGITDLTDPEHDPRTAILCAAAFLQEKATAIGDPPLTARSTEAECALAAWSYNGRAYGSWQNSPYVNNDPQAGRTLHIRGTVPSLGNPAVRERIDRPDPRPGVLAVMRELRLKLDAPVTPPPAVSTPVNAPKDPVLIAGADGQFKPQQGTRFLIPFPAVMGFSGGKWFIRPASPEELDGGMK